MDINKQISELQQQILLRQMADDGYYLSRQYKEDCKTMYALRQRQKQEKM